jgi:subfamily B ATP-binding cassette protein MsbA
MSETGSRARPLVALLTPYPGPLLGLTLTTVVMTLVEWAGVGLVLSFLSNPAGRVPMGLSWLNAWRRLLAGQTLPVQVAAVAAGLVGISLLHGLLLFTQQLISVHLKVRVENDLRRRIFSQFHRIQPWFVETQKLGAWMPLLGLYATQSGQLALVTAKGAAAGVVILLYAVWLAFLSWPLALLGAVLMGLLVFGLRPVFTSRLRRASTLVRECLKQMMASGQESLAGLKVIHLFGREEWSQKRFDRHLAEYERLTRRENRLVSFSRPLFGSLAMLTLGAVLVTSAALWRGSAGGWPAQMALFLFIAMRLSVPVTDLGQTHAQIGQNLPPFKAVLEFLETRDKPYPTAGTTRFDALRDGVRLEHVTFRYGTDDSPVLNNVSLDIPAGRMIGLVGVSGAGKTTLVNLLARLYDCTEGRILVDGVDLRDLEIDGWRSRLAVVNQDPFLFHASVMDNLRFARPDAPDGEIFRAAKLAQAHEFVLDMPQGYDTILLDRGMRLSGGQRQRIALARALLVDAQLLVLDEATSELDSRTEVSIQEGLEEYRRGRTLLVIAHRLSAVRRADRIIVLEAGQVAEQGAHDELLKLRGVYWRLARAQSLPTDP